MNDMEKWHETMMSLHYEPSERGKLISSNVKLRDRLYAEWSEANPEHTKEEGQKKFRDLHNSLDWE